LLEEYREKILLGCVIEMDHSVVVLQDDGIHNRLSVCPSFTANGKLPRVQETSQSQLKKVSLLSGRRQPRFRSPPLGGVEMRTNRISNQSPIAEYRAPHMPKPPAKIF
jgi:hypothetical protein